MPKVSDKNRKWWILVSMTGALSMILIDTTVVSVALPTIQRDLSMDQTSLQWIVNAYLLSMAALIAVGGRLADMFSKYWIYIIGIVIFVTASAFAGFAQNEWQIIAARAIEGVGGALMIPPSQAIVVNSFGPKERGQAMGIYAGISMVFLALGPMIGGFFTQDLSWRYVFLVNLPVGIAVVILTVLVVPKDKPTSKQATLDKKGIATLVPGLTAVVLALMQSSNWGWASPATLVLLIGGGLLIALFIYIEPKVRGALVELRLFKSRNFSGNTAVLFLVQFALMGLTVFGSIWAQNVLGFSPIAAGLSLLPLTIPLLIVAPISGKIYDRVGPRALVAVGALIIGCAFLWSAAFLHRVDYWLLMPAYVMQGLGLALVMTPANTDAMNSAPAKLRGQASGAIQTMRQIGGTFGIAIMGTIVANVQTTKLTDFLSGSAGLSGTQTDQLEKVLSEAEAGQTQLLAGVPTNLLHESVAAAKQALTSGVSSAYYVAGSVMILAAIMALLVLRKMPAVDSDGSDVGPVF